MVRNRTSARSPTAIMTEKAITLINALSYKNSCNFGKLHFDDC